MKKIFKKLFATLVLISVCTSLTFFTIIEVIAIIRSFFGILPWEYDLGATAIAALPLIAYTWWAWTREFSINSIKKLLYD